MVGKAQLAEAEGKAKLAEVEGKAKLAEAKLAEVSSLAEGKAKLAEAEAEGKAKLAEAEAKLASVEAAAASKLASVEAAAASKLELAAAKAEAAVAVAEEKVERIPFMLERTKDLARRLAIFQVVVGNRIVVEDLLKEIYTNKTATDGFVLFQREQLTTKEGVHLPQEALAVLRQLCPDHSSKLSKDVSREYLSFMHPLCSPVHYFTDSGSHLRGMACGGAHPRGPAVGIVVALLQKKSGSSSPVLFVDAFGKAVKRIVQGRVEPVND